MIEREGNLRLVLQESMLLTKDLVTYFLSEKTIIDKHNVMAKTRDRIKYMKTAYDQVEEIYPWWLMINLVSKQVMNSDSESKCVLYYP